MAVLEEMNLGDLVQAAGQAPAVALLREHTEGPEQVALCLGQMTSLAAQPPTQYIVLVDEEAHPVLA